MKTIDEIAALTAHLQVIPELGFTSQTLCYKLNMLITKQSMKSTFCDCARDAGKIDDQVRIASSNDL